MTSDHSPGKIGNHRLHVSALFLSPDARLRPIWRFFIAAVLVIALQYAAAAAAYTLLRNHLEYFDVLFRPLWLGLLLGVFCVMLSTLDRVPNHLLANMGLGLNGFWKRDFMLGGFVGLSIILACVLAISLLGKLTLSLRPPPRVLQLTVVNIWVLATAALAEEVAFRGYAFQRLTESLGGWGATAILSFAFGLVHLRNPDSSPIGFVNTILIGILFCVAYLRTGSLWFCWGLHFFWNFSLGMLFGLPVSGLTEFAVAVKGAAIGPEWLTGGSYGIEASAVCMAVCVVVTTVLAFSPGARRRQTS